MMVAADAKADAAVFVVGHLRIFQGIEIQVDHIVQRADCRLHRFLHIFLVLHGQIAEGEARKVADHEIARPRARHHNGIAVFGAYLRGNMLDGRHILRDLRAEVGAVDHPRMSVGIHPVHRVAVKGEGRARFHRRAQHQPNNILDRHGALGNARVVYAVRIPLFPFVPVIVLQRIALDGQNLVRTHQVPRRVDILIRQFPEQVGIADGGEHVVGLHAVVAVVGTQLKKLRQIPVPDVQIDCHRTLPHPKLIHRHGGIVYEPDPSDHAACRALKAANGAAGGAHLSKVHPHAAAELGDLGKVINRAVNAVQAVGHSIDKAAGKLVIGLAGVGQGGRRHRDLQTAEHIIDAPDPLHSVPLFLHGKVQSNAEKHLLRRFQRHTVMRLDDIPFEQQIKA